MSPSTTRAVAATKPSMQEFVLKAMPPRMPRSALRRERLARRWAELRECSTIACVAPGGFGKTTLLLHWRRLWLERGALVAWLNVDGRDDPVRFRMALMHALRHASGRMRFDAVVPRDATPIDYQSDDLTGVLAGIAMLGIETVILIDEVERLPKATIDESLIYLVQNAPPNLHLVLGSRMPLPLETAELVAKGQFAQLGVADLRLELDESTAILERRFGGRMCLDERVALHETCEGWPIGLQLAAATIEKSADLPTAVRDLSARRGPIESYFVASLFAGLSPEMAGFLTRISILEHLNADLCGTVAGSASATAWLARLILETPILMVGQSKEWCRLHPLARDFLRGRFEELPADDRRNAHRRAAAWFAHRQRFPDAARHALAAGDTAIAHAHAARSLWTLGTEGRMAEAREWLVRIPPQIIAQDIDLRLIAAWIMALGDRNVEALGIAQRLLVDPGLDSKALFVAALVAASAAGFADRLGLIPGILARWPEGSAAIDMSGHPAAYANCAAILALHQGRTEHTRQLEPRAPASAYKYSPVLGRAVGRVLVGISYLWDGNAERAEAVMRPALQQAEQAGGRRGSISCMFAAVMAAALLERNRPVAAQTVLAGRLDVIESTAFPDVVLLAYRTLAYAALSQDNEQRALEILDGLGTLGEARWMPRLVMHSLVERIRIHALQSRDEAVATLERALDGLAPEFAKPEFALYRPQYDLQSAIAKAYAALGRDDPASAERHLMLADALAAELHRGRDALIVNALRAVVAHKRGAPFALRLLGEARSLARIGGNKRLLMDSHPVAMQMSAELRTPVCIGKKSLRQISEPAEAMPDPGNLAMAQGGLLTPKEAEILGLLGNQLSNKLIARAMGISDETVKWHLKNLFSKLSAGSRQHAVDRARLLGLIAG